MDLSESQPGPSGTKRKRTALFTVQKVLDYFEDLSELDGDNDQDYPESDLESESDSELDLDQDNSSNDGRGTENQSNQSAERGGLRQRVQLGLGGSGLKGLKEIQAVCLFYL